MDGLHAPHISRNRVSYTFSVSEGFFLICNCMHSPNFRRWVMAVERWKTSNYS